MCDKMPYLKEDEIVINSKTANTATSNSSASDVDDAEESSLFENKVSSESVQMISGIKQQFMTRKNNNNNSNNKRRKRTKCTIRNELNKQTCREVI